MFRVFVEQPGHGRLAALLGEVAGHARHVGVAVAGHRLAETRLALHRGEHVERPGDGGDPFAAARDQVVGGHPGAGAVGEVDVGDGDRLVGAGEQHDGGARLGQHRREGVVGVGGDQDRAVDVALADVVDDLGPRVGGLGEHQHQVDAERS